MTVPEIKSSARHASASDGRGPRLVCGRSAGRATLGGETHQIGILDRNGPTQVSLAYFRTSKVARMQFRTRDELNALKKRAQEPSSTR